MNAGDSEQIGGLCILIHYYQRACFSCKYCFACDTAINAKNVLSLCVCTYLQFKELKNAMHALVYSFRTNVRKC